MPEPDPTPLFPSNRLTAEVDQAIDTLNNNDRRKWALCPYATTTTCYRLDDRANLTICTGCRSWDCDVCSRRRKAALAHRIAEAQPNRMLTLTCRHEGGPQHQYDVMRTNLSKFFRSLRIDFGSIEYCRIMEDCRDGYPHFHCLVRSGYLPQPHLKREWESRTGARILDIRQIHRATVGYCTKYVTKSRPTANAVKGQRVSVSHAFWKERPDGVDAIGWQHDRQHPHMFYNAAYREQFTAHRDRPLVYVMDAREPGDEWPRELCGMYDVDPY